MPRRPILPSSTLGALLITVSTLAGCGSSDDLPCSNPTPTSIVNVQAVIGSWHGGVDWTIEFTLSSDNRFHKYDYVAPCSGECVWSGIVENVGSWQLTNGRLTLTYEQPNTNFGATTPPELFAISCPRGTAFRLSDGAVFYSYRPAVK